MTGSKQEALEYITGLEDDAIVKCEQIKETRSINQNRLYFAYLSDIRDYLKDTGMMMTVDALHESFKDTFIEGVHSISLLTGKPICERKSTTKLNTKEFSQYIKDIQSYLQDSYNIDIPLRTELNLLMNNLGQ